MWTPGKTLDEVEKDVILHALKYCEGNRTKVSSMLGITTKTLYNKLERWGMNEKSSDETKAGIHLEPTAEVAPKRTMPVQERKKV